MLLFFALFGQWLLWNKTMRLFRFVFVLWWGMYRGRFDGWCEAGRYFFSLCQSVQKTHSGGACFGSTNLACWTVVWRKNSGVRCYGVFAMSQKIPNTGQYTILTFCQARCQSEYQLIEWGSKIKTIISAISMNNRALFFPGQSVRISGELSVLSRWKLLKQDVHSQQYSPVLHWSYWWRSMYNWIFLWKFSSL